MKTISILVLSVLLGALGCVAETTPDPSPQGGFCNPAHCPKGSHMQPPPGCNCLDDGTGRPLETPDGGAT